MKFLLYLFCFSPALLLAQDVNLPRNANNKVEYSNVINIDSISAVDLFSRVKKSLNKIFISSNDVIQVLDDNSNTAIAKGYFKVIIAKMLTPVEGDVWFECELASKDNRYKYSFRNFELKYRWGSMGAEKKISFDDDANGNQFSAKQWNKIKQQVNDQVNALIGRIEAEMLSKDEW